MMKRIRHIVATALLWSLWLICILLILPVLINVPGRATAAELNLYFAALAAATGYPILLPILTVAERRTRHASQAGAATIHAAIWVAFVWVLATFAVVALRVYAQERAKPVPTRAEIVQGSYANAILWHDTGWMDRLMAEGASVDTLLQPYAQTPAVMSAGFGDWTMVEFLLGRGADPDKKDSQGNTVRTLAASPPTVPTKPEEKAALDKVRMFLTNR